VSVLLSVLSKHLTAASNFLGAIPQQPLIDQHPVPTDIPISPSILFVSFDSNLFLFTFFDLLFLNKHNSKKVK
jgi:hypothetical protein